MSEALRRPIRRNPRLGHAVGRTARCFTQRTYGLEFSGLTESRGLIGIGGRLATPPPPTPPGIRVPYHGGSTELGLCGCIDSGKTERLEIVVAWGLLDRRVSGHAP